MLGRNKGFAYILLFIISVQDWARKIPHDQGKKLGGVGKHKLWIGIHFCYSFLHMVIFDLLAIIFSVLTFLFPSSLVVLLSPQMCLMRNCNFCLLMDSTVFYIFYRINCIFFITTNEASNSFFSNGSNGMS